MDSETEKVKLDSYGIEEEIIALRIYTIITASLVFKTFLGSESIVF